MEAAATRGLGFSLFLAASRLTVASIILIPAWRNFQAIKLSSQAYYYAIGAGFCLALHFAAWITSLSFTSIAASTTLVTTNPLWVTLLSWLWLKEKPNRLTIIGMIVALIGGGLIALGGDITKTGNNSLFGNCLALIGAVLVSLYLLLGREAQKRGLGISSYIIIVYSAAAIILLPFPIILDINYFQYPWQVYLYILLMAIFSQLIGHTSINWALKRLSPTIVTLAILFEPIGASFLGFLIFQEVPSAFVMLGGLILLVGVSIAVIGEN
jgi:drug/metabolite transporter (DMT)-like permease